MSELLHFVINFIIAAAILGYVLNVLWFITSVFRWRLSDATIRFVGMVFAPLGCLLGYANLSKEKE